MNINAVKNAVVFGATHAKLYGIKIAPHVMIGLGVIGFGATIVAASKAAKKVDAIIEESDETLGKVRFLLNEVEEHPEEHPTRTPEELRQAILAVYAKRWLDLGKLYAPTIGLGLASLWLILGSHKIMTTRNAALAAAYRAVSVAFNKYRQNVIAEQGKEKDDIYRFGITEKEVAVIEETAEGAKLSTVNVKVPNEVSMYARWFEEGSSVMWKQNPTYNKFFLKSVQDEMNFRLGAQGFIFLNDVYSHLGLKQEDYGQLVGWIKDPTGSVKIDFGLEDPRNQAFNERKTSDCHLDFNVQGVVFDLI